MQLPTQSELSCNLPCRHPPQCVPVLLLLAAGCQVLSIYEVRSLQEQRRLIAELYDDAAIYENNITLLQGRDEIIKRFTLLPLSTHSVKVEYEKPVVLGATTSA